ncbi:NUMOD4 domain-containing protein [Bacteroides neonati]|uniref:NUMOD4 domain-containing protein n=1 Tax=Bacteroides neonati TaxID=1347393 RepID=UPI0004B1146B|nr:NUMOD4 domain-containing protein [Bacteroides neonati]
MKNQTINSEEIWKTIPEFPSYQVSSLGQIRSACKNRKEVLLKKRNKYVSLYRQGKAYCVSANKVMYSVFNNIPLSSLKGLFIIGETLDTLQLFTPRGIMDEIRAKRRKHTAIEVERMQMETYDDVRTVIHVWKSGDTSKFYARVESHKNNTIAYLQRRFGIRRSDAEEYWSEASAILYSSVLNKERPIIGFAPWLKSTAKNIILTVQKEKRRMREFDDRRCYESY